MKKKWQLTDLDFNKAREYIVSQDPDVSSRFVLPVPNWMDGAHPSVTDEQIKQVPKKGGLQWRYTFTNPEDGAEQGVKIDGTSSIIFMGLNEDKAERLSRLVSECLAGKKLTPEVLTTILDRANRELGIQDRFNKDLASIDRYFHPHNAQGHLGTFIPNPSPSCAIYIAGEGEYLNGPTLTPQRFENGAFINFPGVRLTDIFDVEVRGSGRLVQAAVFLRDRTLPDGNLIDLKNIPTQSR